jgi:hypothetical protein
MSAEKRVDEDWKRRAQADKELDAVKAAPPPPAVPGAKPDIKPSPLFGGLVESLASQALLFMGAMRDPMGGPPQQDLQQSHTMIEMLAMLEEKTKGNLSKEEAEMIKQVLSEVRMHFVRITEPPPMPPKGPMMGNRP